MFKRLLVLAATTAALVLGVGVGTASAAVCDPSTAYGPDELHLACRDDAETSGTVITVTNPSTPFRCDTTLTNETHPQGVKTGSGWPVYIKITFSAGVNPSIDGFTYDPGCQGDGDPDTIDLVLEVDGNGYTTGVGQDAVKTRQTANATNGLQVTGYAACGPIAAGAHQDGIQLQGGNRFEAYDFTFGATYDDWAAGLPACSGAGGSYFISAASGNLPTNMLLENSRVIGCNKGIGGGTSGSSGTIRNVISRGFQNNSDWPSPRCSTTNFAINACNFSSNGWTVLNLTCDNYPFSGSPTPPDTDGDGVPDSTDNCPSVPNPSQTDTDEDGIGDACDEPDADGDGVPDDADNCPSVSNPSQADQDNDGIGDACDPVNNVDSDGDGVVDSEDNCPLVFNPGQTDTDEDGIGDACDAPPGGGGPPGEVTVESLAIANAQTTGTTLVLTVPAGGVDVGDTIIIASASNNGATGVSVTDSDGNTYVTDVEQVQGSNVLGSLLSARVTDALEESDTITVTYPSATSRRLAEAVVITGLAEADWRGPATSQAQASVTALSSGSVTTTVEDAVVFGSFAWNNGGSAESFTPGTSFTSITTSTADNRQLFTEYRVVETTGGYSATATASASGSAASLVGTYYINALADADEDGVSDSEDNCPLIPNPAQTDSDEDGLGDDCDVPTWQQYIALAAALAEAEDDLADALADLAAAETARDAALAAQAAAEAAQATAESERDAALAAQAAAEAALATAEAERDAALAAQAAAEAERDAALAAQALAESERDDLQDALDAIEAALMDVLALFP